MSFVRNVTGVERHKSLLFLALAAALIGIPSAAQTQDATASAQKTAPALGTIKAITDKTLTLKTDAGAEVNVQFSPAMRILRVEPGSKTLKDAVAIPLAELAVGDRILVRGDTSGQPNVMVATTIVAMKKEDIAKKRAGEREEWQRHGVGGLVKTVDPARETIIISALSPTGTKDVLIHAPVGTILRRYAPGSVNFDDAKAAPLAEIRPGDQLRARGSRSADDGEFTADEIVSGTFHNIAGTIASIDSAKSTLTISDLATKKNVEVSVTAQSQLRKLPAPVAQRIAMRLKGGPADANGAGGASSGAAASGQSAAPSAGQGSAGGGVNGAAGPAGGQGAQRGGGDLQQMLSRLPVSPLADFQKGDAVMIVATSGTTGAATVITLLGGVEPILQSAPEGQASSILTPWSLNSGAADAGTQ